MRRRDKRRQSRIIDRAQESEGEREKSSQHISLNKNKLQSSDHQLLRVCLINMVMRPQVCRAGHVATEAGKSQNYVTLSHYTSPVLCWIFCSHLYPNPNLSRASLCCHYVRANVGANMAVAAACPASGLMGRNDRNLELIMQGLEMFVSR